MINKKEKENREDDLISAVSTSFFYSRSRYGARKIQIDLQQKQLYVSRRKIRQIMKRYQLESVYTKKNIDQVQQKSMKHPSKMLSNEHLRIDHH